jgi:hypothetical protein
MLGIRFDYAGFQTRHADIGGREQTPVDRRERRIRECNTRDAEPEAQK